ncbi:MAG: putative glycosyltransferase [Frankiales bacterium]|nr:putative glycosyltransferase [Frankiales bacterium]
MLSVVVPMYNEQLALPHFAERLRPVLDDLPMPYEVLCVDDGSTDGTGDLLREMLSHWPQLRVLPLRRNAGHQAALTAGLDHARGDWIVSIDADLQDPPHVIREMLDVAQRTGVDVVYGVRADRSTDTRFKRVTAGLYYGAMRRAAGVEIPRHAGDFRLMSASAVREVGRLHERGRVYRLLIPYMGFRYRTVEYRRESRVAGDSKYPVHKMARLAAESYTSFTTAPLRFATWLGVLGFVLCSTFAVAALVAYATGNTLPGWTSFAIVIGFVGALQFLFLGLLGEYVARIYTEMQARPRYFTDVHPPDDPARQARSEREHRTR